MSAAISEMGKDVKSKGEGIQPSSFSDTTSKSVLQTSESRNTLIPEKVMKLLYQYAEEAILKEIQIGSKTFKNYLRNRLEENNVSDKDIEMALQNANYSQLKGRYIKDGKVIAKESQKYTLTAHAKERMSKPDLKNVTLLFEKYLDRAKELGIKGEKKHLAYLKEKIQPRNIKPEAIADVIDGGRCQILPGKRLKYTKDGLSVIVSKHDHSIITAYRSSIMKQKPDSNATACASGVATSYK